jgi:hypothetical protein
MELYVSIVGAFVAILVSVIGAILSYKYSINLQTRKLKEEHYIVFFESLHNLAATNSKEATIQYTFARDKLFLVASELVVKKLLEYEKNYVGKISTEHDKGLTELIKAIRKDLKLKNKGLPTLHLKKG